MTLLPRLYIRDHQQAQKILADYHRTLEMVQGRQATLRYELSVDHQRSGDARRVIAHLLLLKKNGREE